MCSVSFVFEWDFYKRFQITKQCTLKMHYPTFKKEKVKPWLCDKYAAITKAQCHGALRFPQYWFIVQQFSMQPGKGKQCRSRKGQTSLCKNIAVAQQEKPVHLVNLQLRVVILYLVNMITGNIATRFISLLLCRT